LTQQHPCSGGLLFDHVCNQFALRTSIRLKQAQCKLPRAPSWVPIGARRTPRNCCLSTVTLDSLTNHRLIDQRKTSLRSPLFWDMQSHALPSNEITDIGCCGFMTVTGFLKMAARYIHHRSSSTRRITDAPKDQNWHPIIPGFAKYHHRAITDSKSHSAHGLYLGLFLVNYCRIRIPNQSGDQRLECARFPYLVYTLSQSACAAIGKWAVDPPRNSQITKEPVAKCTLGRFIAFRMTVVDTLRFVTNCESMTGQQL